MMQKPMTDAERAGYRQAVKIIDEARIALNAEGRWVKTSDVLTIMNELRAALDAAPARHDAPFGEFRPAASPGERGETPSVEWLQKRCAWYDGEVQRLRAERDEKDKEIAELRGSLERIRKSAFHHTALLIADAALTPPTEKR